MAESLKKENPVSNGLYQKNREVFARRFAALLTHIEKLDVRHYHLEPADQGSYFLKVEQHPGRFINMGDAIDPVAEARALVPDFTDGDKSLFVVLGMGLGHLVLEAVKKYPKARFIVVEQDGRVFRKAMEALDLREVFAAANVEFVVSLNADILYRYFMGHFANGDHHLYLPAIKVLMNPLIVSYSRDYYNRVAAILKQVMDDFWYGVVGNDYKDALIGFGHVLKNLKYHERFLAVEPMQNLFSDRVGVVVSSGPSLDEQIQMLKEHQHRSVIICADTALKKLLQNGITPFGVTSIERNFNSDKLFKDIAVPPDLVLFAPALIKPEIIRDFPGKVCFLGKTCYPFYWLPELAPLWEAGHSCSHVSAKALDYLGCRKVALLGQDLAFHPHSGASHFGGVMDFVSAGYGERDKILVPRNGGGEIATTQVWLMFRNEFSNIVKLHTRAKFFNVIPSGFGASIEGVQHVEPESFWQDLAAEPEQVLQQDFKKLRQIFVEKWAIFFPELKVTCEASIRQLKNMDDQLSHLSTATDFTEFYHLKNKMLEQLDERTTHLMDELSKPTLKPFESRSFALSSSRDFRQEVPELVKELKMIHSELLKTLEDNYRELFV